METLVVAMNSFIYQILIKQLQLLDRVTGGRSTAGRSWD